MQTQPIAPSPAGYTMHINMAHTSPFEAFPLESRETVKNIRFLPRKQAVILLRMLQKKHEDNIEVLSAITLFLLDCEETNDAFSLAQYLFIIAPDNFGVRCSFAYIGLQLGHIGLIEKLLQPFEISKFLSETDTVSLFHLQQFHYLVAVFLLATNSCAASIEHINKLKDLAGEKHAYVRHLYAIVGNCNCPSCTQLKNEYVQTHTKS